MLGKETTAPLQSNRLTDPRGAVEAAEVVGSNASDGGGFGRRDGGATGVAPCVSNTLLRPSHTKDTAGASVRRGGVEQK